MLYLQAMSLFEITWCG